MTFRGKGRKQRANGSWVNEDYLVCDGYQRGLGCSNGFHFNYAIWEEGILAPIIYEALHDQKSAPQSEVREIEIEVARLERIWDIAKARADSALRLAVETNRNEAQTLWTELAAVADKAGDELDDARARLLELSHAPSAEEQQKRVGELWSSLQHEDETIRFEARSRVMAATHALIHRLTFFGPDPLGVDMELAGDRLISVHYDEVNRGTDWSMCDIDDERISRA